MDYIVSVRVKINNPSWDDIFFRFIFRYIYPLVPFFKLIIKGITKLTVIMHDTAEFLAGVILFFVALIGMGLTIGIPIVLFSAAMGWIK